MAMVDFSTQQGWQAMEWRATMDARDAVEAYWPRGGEASPQMPQDLDWWARWLALEFMRESMQLPVWSQASQATFEGIQLTALHAYQRICVQQLKFHVWERIRDGGKLPRQTVPPHYAGQSAARLTPPPSAQHTKQPQQPRRTNGTNGRSPNSRRTQPMPPQNHDDDYGGGRN